MFEVLIVIFEHMDQIIINFLLERVVYDGDFKVQVFSENVAIHDWAFV